MRLWQGSPSLEQLKISVFAYHSQQNAKKNADELKRRLYKTVSKGESFDYALFEKRSVSGLTGELQRTLSQTMTDVKCLYYRSYNRFWAV